MITLVILLAISITANIVLFTMFSATNHLLRIRTERLNKVLVENQDLFLDQFRRSAVQEEPFDGETFH